MIISQTPKMTPMPIVLTPTFYTPDFLELTSDFSQLAIMTHDAHNMDLWAGAIAITFIDKTFKNTSQDVSNRQNKTRYVRIEDNR